MRDPVSGKSLIRFAPSRLLSILLILTMIFQSPAWASGEPVTCATNLTVLVEKQIQEAISHFGFLRRRKLKKNLERLKAHVEQEVRFQCPEIAIEDCPKEKLEAAVASAVEKTLADVAGSQRGLVKAFSLFAGAVVMNAIFIWQVRSHVDQDTALLLTGAMAFITANLIQAVAAPFLTPITASIGKWAWGNGSTVGANRETRETPMARVYDEVYRGAQEALKNTAQQGRGVQRNALATAQWTFALCLQLLHINEVEGWKAVPELVANMLQDIYYSYPEVDFADVSFRRYAQAMLGRKHVTVENFASFSASVMASMREVDPLLESNTRLDADYHRVLNAWFRPGARPPGRPYLPEDGFLASEEALPGAPVEGTVIQGILAELGRNQFYPKTPRFMPPSNPE